MDISLLTDAEFQKFKKLIYDLAGINLSNEKKALVAGRLQKRLRYYGLNTYSEYYEIIQAGDKEEIQMMVDLLTTNETYFFREPDHFDFLNEVSKDWEKNADKNRKFRIWSAASSSGEEAYTIGFVLANNLPLEKWEIIGTDISEKVIAKASEGVYPMSRAEKISKEILRKYCLKGVRSQSGTFKIQDFLRKRISFVKFNLLNDPSHLGKFDIIFLRNVMIYFDKPTRNQVVERLLDQLTDKGYLILGHAESLLGVTQRVRLVRPTVYQRVN